MRPVVLLRTQRVNKGHFSQIARSKTKVKAVRSCSSVSTLLAETVKTHVRNALVKFNLHGKSELRMALGKWDFSEWE